MVINKVIKEEYRVIMSRIQEWEPQQPNMPSLCWVTARIEGNYYRYVPHNCNILIKININVTETCDVNNILK